MKKLFINEDDLYRIWDISPNDIKSKLLKQFDIEELSHYLVSFENLGEINGFNINGDLISNIQSNYGEAKYVFSDEVEAHRASCHSMLSQLKRVLGEECIIDWNDDTTKYCIIRNGDSIMPIESINKYEYLAFKTKSIRDDFANRYVNIIEGYYA